MQQQDNKLDFTNQKIFIGLDVHKNKWVVTIRMNHIELKTFSMEASAGQLIKYLQKHYPQAECSVVYEAVFSGYWIQRHLSSNGIAAIIVNPADIPTTGKEKDRKDDHKDSRKLARELENNTLKGIYIPDEAIEELRSLNRISTQYVGEKARMKNRIKSFLFNYGKEFPGRNSRYWSEALLEKIKDIKFYTPIAEESIKNYVEHLSTLQEKVKKLEARLKVISKEFGFDQIIGKLETIPGIGFISAITIFTEIMDIKRFRRLDELCSYVGIVPSTHSSGEKEKIGRLTFRQKRYLKNIIIEAAWIAARKDPALTMSYSRLIKRMEPQKAIIKIAKKLLNRIRYVWKNNIEYQLAVVE